MTNKPIFLIGFMASGKTKLGKKIAKRLGFEFIDLDSRIEAISQETISTIFKNRGEEEFRVIESSALKELALENPAIVALGGGTPCYLDNMNFIKEAGKSIYLKLNASLLLGRLRADKANRPLVSNLDDAELIEFVNSTLKKREHIYNRADYIFNPEENTFDELVKLVLS